MFSRNTSIHNDYLKLLVPASVFHFCPDSNHSHPPQALDHQLFTLIYLNCPRQENCLIHIDKESDAAGDDGFDDDDDGNGFDDDV